MKEKYLIIGFCVLIILLFMIQSIKREGLTKTQIQEAFKNKGFKRFNRKYFRKMCYNTNCNDLNKDKCNSHKCCVWNNDTCDKKK